MYRNVSMSQTEEVSLVSSWSDNCVVDGKLFCSFGGTKILPLFPTVQPWRMTIDTTEQRNR